MKKLWKLAVYMLVFAFLLTGCGDNIVAKVNGEKITETELNNKVEQVAMMNGHNLEGEHGAVVRGFLEEQILEALIMEKLVLQDAKAKKIPLEKKKLKEELKNMKASFTSDKEYKEFLAANKLTEKELKKMYETMFIYNGLFEEVTKDIAKPSQDLEEYYQEHQEEFFRPEMVQVRHVLVEKKEEAEDILNALTEGEDFKKLALEKSIDPSIAQNEGLIDYFPKGGYMVPEFEEAAFALKEVGEYTKKPVKTDFGYHIIKLEGRQEEKQFAFEEVKEQLVDRLLAIEKNEKFQAYEAELLAKAEVERMLPQDEADENGEDLSEGSDNESSEENDEQK
ncbi:MAG: peptidyl-prolyl cis-trans isomerase [Clostridia bacterium]|nr:peptidyl-prolyl cis-trans isomerase [Clostridia bacterium]